MSRKDDTAGEILAWMLVFAVYMYIALPFIGNSIDHQLCRNDHAHERALRGE